MDTLSSVSASLTGIGGAESSPPATRPPLDQHESPLFGIPIELRELIYACVLTYRRRLLDPPYLGCQDESAAILRTCRRIYIEARTHVHCEDSCVFTTPEKLKACLARSRKGLQELTLTTRNIRDWARCESWFEEWRGLLVPIPDFTRDEDANASFELNTALPAIDTLIIDFTDISRTIHAAKPIEPATDTTLSYEESMEQMTYFLIYQAWHTQAAQLQNGLMMILYAIIAALDGGLPRPAWLQASTKIRILGPNVKDPSTVVEVEMMANEQAIRNSMGIVQGFEGASLPARLTGPGLYLLDPELNNPPAGIATGTS